jgi:hypothetical protein
MSGLNFYSEALKRSIVIEVHSGQISKEEARRKYGIKGHSTILKWIRKFEGPVSQTNCLDIDKFDKKELIKIKELIILLCSFSRKKLVGSRLGITSRAGKQNVATFN